MTDAYRQRLQAFVQAQITPNIDAWEQLGAYPATLNREAGAAGLLGLGHDHRQLPDDPRAVAVLIEELTRSGAQGITMGLGSHFVSLKAVQATGHPIIHDLVPAVLDGRQSIALAITERQAGSDLRALECRATRQADGYRLNGHKAFICNATRADWLLMVGHCEDGLALFLVEGSAAGIRHTPRRALGWRCLPLADLELENVPAIRLTEKGGVGRLLQASLQQERLNLAVMAITSADMALQAAIDWCKSRQVGGKALFDKSVIRQRLAEHYAQLTVSRQFVDTCVARQAEGTLDAHQVAIAKNSAVQTLETLARDAVQLHGAHGCVEPSLVERIHRDARLLAIGGGTHEIMLEIIARHL
ncbi:acyl-CoA dehydrogenase family protein [Pseudomonas sp. CCOS 191]|uniref:acyl-CoA dehydrogenase family protein n=1 Tax=Pseudomonas sp. CCOS 191 TaxID=1649877 RepID=UPI0006247564|nr:acyl-CoA dehydrogenase family protein [Pseudomonas sp. CCOS 191]CRI58275.1 putative acyl-CoA dehydrogenase [Pseudomonas sp. CCOS 191]